MRISSSLNQHADWLADDAALGFERIYLHHVGKDQRELLTAFADRVLPLFDARAAPGAG